LRFRGFVCAALLWCCSVCLFPCFGYALLSSNAFFLWFRVMFWGSRAPVARVRVANSSIAKMPSFWMIPVWDSDEPTPSPPRAPSPTYRRVEIEAALGLLALGSAVIPDAAVEMVLETDFSDAGSSVLCISPPAAPCAPPPAAAKPFVLRPSRPLRGPRSSPAPAPAAPVAPAPRWQRLLHVEIPSIRPELYEDRDYCRRCVRYLSSRITACCVRGPGRRACDRCRDVRQACVPVGDL
jgi:hypothetical protein